MIKKIVSDKVELSTLVVTLLACVVLWTSVFEVPLVEFMQGGMLSKIIANQHARNFASILAGGVVSAYMLYVLVELIPRYRNEQIAIAVLNKAINTIVDGFRSGAIYQHEKSIEFTSAGLSVSELRNDMERVSRGPNFLQLKSAGHTAETRYQTFKDTLVLAASISASHAETWLIVTDKVRLLAEVMSERPEGDLDINVLADIERRNDDETYSGHPTALFYRSIQFRLYEFLESALKWRALDGRR